MRVSLLLLGLLLAGNANAETDLGSPGLVAATDPSEICGKQGGLTYTLQHRSGSVERSLHCLKGWQSDHQLPISAGGADDVRNLHCQPPDTLAADNLGWQTKDRLDDWAWLQICRKNARPVDIQKLFLAPTQWQVSFCKIFPNDTRC